MKRYRYIDLPNGAKARRSVDLEKKLNLNILQLTNKAQSVGKLDLPAITCRTDILPDYIALYNHPADYWHTANTAVSFFLYDNTFDGKNGLFNAIYYRDVERLEFFKRRFDGVRTFIMPDLSLCGDVPAIENYYRLFRMRLISLWLTMELGAVVIPFVSFSTIENLEFAINGYEDCTVVCFSTKGALGNPSEHAALKQAIKVVVDTLDLASIVVYDVCETNQKAEELFAYASAKGVRVHIPLNMLKERNIQRRATRSAH